MIARISCDNMNFALPGAEHAGCNLRAFFGVTSSEDLWFESREGDDILIRPDATPYFIEDGDRFYTASRKINNG